jgi:hypothetical protein
MSIDKNVYDKNTHTGKSVLVCGRHPKYKGKTEPKRACPECWKLYTDGWPHHPRIPFHIIFRKFGELVERQGLVR